VAQVLERLGQDGTVLMAARSGDRATLRRLIEREGGAVNARCRVDSTEGFPLESGYTPLAYAAYNGDYEMADYLLAKGALPDVIVLIAAARGCQRAMIAHLIESGGWDTSALTAAMVHAVANDRMDVAALMIDSGAQLDGTAPG